MKLLTKNNLLKIIHYIKKYSYLLGIFIFILILTKVNFNQLWQNIKGMKPLYLITALALGFPTLIIKSFCWNYIKRQQGIKYKLKDSFLMYVSSLFISGFTPGRIGEVARAFYLKKDGYSMGKSLVGVIIDRLTDFIFLLVVIVVGSLFFITIFQKQITILILVIIITIVLSMVFLKIGLVKWFFKTLFNKFIPEQYQKSWKLSFQDFMNDLKIYKLKNYIIIFAITIFSWLFYYIQTYALGKGANIEGIPFLYFTVAITITGFITLIPISVAGIGTREAALILLFSPYAISIEKIIAFSSLILLMYLFSCLFGLICWLIKPIRI